MYIEVRQLHSFVGVWEFVLFSTCDKRRVVKMESPRSYEVRANCIRAAKKMAKKLGIEYREYREVK